MYGNFPAKYTVYTLYIRTYVWFWPTPFICSQADLPPELRLGEAARHGEVGVVRNILQKCPDLDVNAANPSGWTPLVSNVWLWVGLA